jgi:NAD(P)-dependent dehydrogenase (short-subunit alcohol dehydrogenase family)
MTVLISGANRGIGLALSQHYASAGTAVIGTYRQAPAPAEKAIDWQPLDVTQTGSAQDLAKRLAGKPLELLVCNAGVYHDRGESLASGFPAEDWASTFAVNVTGVFVVIQSLLPNLRAGAGKIAIISSGMGSTTRAPGGSYIYRASKAAVVNLGRNLASDLKRDKIAVGVYHPGWVRTDMGGASADIDTGQSAAGLAKRFSVLSLTTTGCFESWDGQAIPF